MRKRGFEWVTGYENKNLPFPQRKTAASAGYDLAAAEETVIEPGEVKLVPTGVKAYMLPDEALKIYIRSGAAVKKNLCLPNSVGIIDADYYGNADNEGHIFGAVANFGRERAVLAKGERMAQGIFVKYLTADGDNIGEGSPRRGGFGSTGTK